MGTVSSEDTVRRALKRLDPQKADAWLTAELAESAAPLVRDAPWILDIDVTIKPLYGRAQERADISYNPAKNGRPSRVHRKHSN